MKKAVSLEKIGLNSPANFFAEYELRELGASDSEKYRGVLVLNGKLYQPREDYYVKILKSALMPRT